MSDVPPKPRRVRRKTFGGAMLAAAMVGVQEALEGPKDEEPAIEVANSTDHPDDHIALDLDPIDPSLSIAVVRPDPPTN